jgi:hypothetical protein
MDIMVRRRGTTLSGEDQCSIVIISEHKLAISNSRWRRRRPNRILDLQTLSDSPNNPTVLFFRPRYTHAVLLLSLFLTAGPYFQVMNRLRLIQVSSIHMSRIFRVTLDDISLRTMLSDDRSCGGVVWTCTDPVNRDLSLRRG